jgi:hypothetical protein
VARLDSLGRIGHGAQMPAAVRNIDHLIEQFDATGVEGAASVLIELARAPVSLVAAPALPGLPRPLPTVARARSDGGTAEAALERLLDGLGSLGVTPDSVLRGAGVVVAELDRAQIRRVAEWPDVQAIRANLTHRRSTLPL